MSEKSFFTPTDFAFVLREVEHFSSRLASFFEARARGEASTTAAPPLVEATPVPQKTAGDAGGQPAAGPEPVIPAPRAEPAASPMPPSESAADPASTIVDHRIKDVLGRLKPEYLALLREIARSDVPYRCNVGTWRFMRMSVNLKFRRLSGEDRDLVRSIKTEDGQVADLDPQLLAALGIDPSVMRAASPEREAPAPMTSPAAAVDPVTARNIRFALAQLKPQYLELLREIAQSDAAYRCNGGIWRFMRTSFNVQYRRYAGDNETPLIRTKQTKEGQFAEIDDRLLAVLGVTRTPVEEEVAVAARRDAEAPASKPAVAASTEATPNEETSVRHIRKVVNRLKPEYRALLQQVACSDTPFVCTGGTWRFARTSVNTLYRALSGDAEASLVSGLKTKDGVVAQLDPCLKAVLTGGTLPAIDATATPDHPASAAQAVPKTPPAEAEQAPDLSRIAKVVLDTLDVELLDVLNEVARSDEPYILDRSEVWKWLLLTVNTRARAAAGGVPVILMRYDHTSNGPVAVLEPPLRARILEMDIQPSSPPPASDDTPPEQGSSEEPDPTAPSAPDFGAQAAAAETSELDIAMNGLQDSDRARLQAICAFPDGATTAEIEATMANFGNWRLLEQRTSVKLRTVLDGAPTFTVDRADGSMRVHLAEAVRGWLALHLAPQETETQQSGDGSFVHPLFNSSTPLASSRRSLGAISEAERILSQMTATPDESFDWDSLKAYYRAGEANIERFPHDRETLPHLFSNPATSHSD